MTIGIYCLHFEGTDKVYIGQSENINQRYTKHLLVLRKNSGKKRLQEAYNKFGIPKLEIILECTKEELDISETEAIEIYDSFNNGFNSTKGGTTGIRLRGDKAPNAVYSKTQIIRCFNLLIENILTANKIAETVGVSPGIVRSISSLQSHTWLKEEFPEKYSILISLIGNKSYNSAKSKGIIYPELLDPLGNVHSVDNLTKFAKEYNLNKGHLGAVLRRQEYQHKGWRLSNGH